MARAARDKGLPGPLAPLSRIPKEAATLRPNSSHRANPRQ